MARNESSTKTADVDMPPDGTEAPDQSPIASETVRRAPKRQPAKKGQTRTVREYEEQVPEGEEQEDREGRHEGPEFMDESALAMCHVSRVGPGTGAGWVGGMFYDHGDGRGPQPVSKGPVGSFQKTKDLFDVVVSEAGGGRFRFVTKGQPPYEETFPNPPLPLPMEQQGQPRGYPNGAMPNGRGGFERGGFDQTWGQEQEYGGNLPPQDPFNAPDYDPTIGVEPEAFTQTGLNGWFRGGPYNRILYYVNGQPSRPPRGAKPPVALLAGGAIHEGYDPGAYDHSDRGDDRIAVLEKKLEDALKDKRDDRLDKIERLLTEKQSGGAMESMMTMMMKSMDDAQKARDHEFRMMQERIKTEDKESKAKAASDATAAVATRQIDLQIAQARASADEKIAAANASILQANATAAMANAKEIAAITSASNDKMFTLMLSKTDHEGGLDKAIDRSIKIAEMMGGNGKTDNVAGEIAEAIQTATPALAKAGTDIAYAFKGYSPPPPSAQQPGPQSPPQIPSGVPQPPQLPAPPAAEDLRAEAVQGLQLLGGLCNAWKNRAKPTAAPPAHLCLAYNIQRSEER